MHGSGLAQAAFYFKERERDGAHIYFLLSLRSCLLGSLRGFFLDICYLLMHQGESFFVYLVFQSGCGQLFRSMYILQAIRPINQVIIVIIIPFSRHSSQRLPDRQATRPGPATPGCPGRVEAAPGRLVLRSNLVPPAAAAQGYHHHHHYHY